MKIRLLIFLSFFFTSVYSQQEAHNKYIKLTGGKVSFGTGDFFGYGFSTELSKNIIKHVNVGVEATIENGRKQPSVNNNLLTFHQVSNAAVTLKMNYYPFNKFVKGFNVDVGPTLGYQSKTTEAGHTTYFDSVGTPYLRRTILEYNNTWFTGYRISLNYDFNFIKGFLFGLRSDFSNYNNGDINILLGVKAGYRF